MNPLAPAALVTGSSRGIGRGIAVALAAAGHDLLIHYSSRREGAEETAAACDAAARKAGRPVQTRICQADLALAADRHRLVDATREAFGRLDLLVNNAGVAPSVRADLLDASEESFDRLMGINLKGPFFLTQEVARWMVEQAATLPAGSPRPKIISVSSVSAYAPSVNRAEYCLSKAGISMLTALFAARLAEHGISVFEIRPGIIATDMTTPVRERYDRLLRDGFTPINRWGTPEDVARAVVAIAGGAFPFSTGEVFNVDGGFHLRRL